ncbi:MAG: ROK family protein [Propioniciclava sp.]
MGEVVGVDIGGNSIRAQSGDRSLVARRPVGRASTLEEVLAAIEAVLVEVAADPSARMTIAVPTFVGPGGRLLEAPAVPALTGVDLAAEVAVRLGRAHPQVVPDLAAAAWGESQQGAGRGVDRLLCVAVGTGVNAAAVVDGEVLDTAFGCLGDAGHVNVEPDGPRCPCGGRGCLESVCSGWALARAAGRIGLGDAAALAVAARSGNRFAHEAYQRAGAALGRAVASWSALVWPSLVAVAGGVAAAGDLLLEPAARELERVGAPYIVGRIQIVPAGLGAEATLVGARLLAARLPEGA